MSEFPLRTRDLGKFLGDYRLREQPSACQGRSRGALPESSRTSLHTGILTMFVSGDNDAAALLWFASGFSNRVEIVVRPYERSVISGSAHGIHPSPCTERERQG